MAGPAGQDFTKKESQADAPRALRRDKEDIKAVAEV